MFPVAQVTFEPEDLLALANEEMDTAVIPYINSFQEDYFLFSELVNFPKGTTSSPIPYRAVGNKLRDVSYEDSNGNSQKMTRIVVEDVPYFINDQYAYYIENNEIVRLDSSSDVNMRVRYYIRPSSLVLEEKAAYVTNIDRVTGDITVDNIPTGFSAAALIDFLQIKPPYKCISIDVPLLSINSSTKTLNMDPSSIPSKLKVGDFICLAEETIIPQIPTDVHPLLSQRIVCRCLEALGDFEGLNAANTKLIEMEAKLGAVLTDRVEGSPKKIVNRNSTLKSNKRWR